MVPSLHFIYCSVYQLQALQHENSGDGSSTQAAAILFCGTDNACWMTRLAIREY